MEKIKFMNNEKYNQIIDEAYENYKKHIKTQRDIQKEEVKRLLSQGKLVKVGRINLLSREEFINKIKTETDFSERWALKIEERELTLEERYNKWFNNNYETGMERYFDPNDLPDYNDPYYEPTPTKVITVTYREEKIKIYE